MELEIKNILLTPGIYVCCALLNITLPGKHVRGYACDCYSTKPLLYKLNGLITLISVASIWALGGYLKVYELEAVAENYFVSFVVANIMGVAVSIFFFIDGLLLPEAKRQNYWRCPTRDKQTKQQPTLEEKEYFMKQSLLSKYYHGHRFNPRLGSLDVKMYLYLVGAVMLWLNIFSHFMLAYKNLGYFTNASIIYVWMFNHFLFEYLYFEEVHLYTYDLFAEKIGFKLVWGCFVFYPFCYCVGARYIQLTLDGRDTTIIESALVLCLFYSGWVLTRGSNLQKFFFKKNPTQKSCFKGLIEQKALPGTKILISGFWGMARHVNYLGEILQSVAISIPCVYLSSSLVPFLYPIYYVLLFVPRQFDDDVICEKKYGDHWKRYKQLVPFRIIPGVW